MAQWMNAEQFLALLREIVTIDLDGFFGITDDSDLSEMFYAEVAYLNHWNESSDQEPELEGIDLGSCSDGNLLSFQFTCTTASVKSINFHYILINPQSTERRYVVKIYYDETPVYNRTPSQKPRTEWLYNQLADVNDQDGNPYFG